MFLKKITLKFWIELTNILHLKQIDVLNIKTKQNLCCDSRVKQEQC